jgi:hypothetical protein
MLRYIYYQKMDRFKTENMTVWTVLLLTLFPLGFTVSNGIFLFGVDVGVDCIYQDNNSTTNGAQLF